MEKRIITEQGRKKCAQQIGRDFRPVGYFILGFWLLAACLIWSTWPTEASVNTHVTPNAPIEVAH